MGWRWVTGDATEDPRAELGQEFPTQADAEAWLTASYEDLAEAGVSAVTLCEDDRVVYGPMSLSA